MPILCVSSAAGGAGKTTLAAHLAAILFDLNQKVVLVELSEQNLLSAHFGGRIDGAGGIGVFAGSKDADLLDIMARQAHRLHDDFLLVPYGAKLPDAAEPGWIDRALAELSTAAPQTEIADHVIILDLPPTMAPERYARFADMFLYVLDCDAKSLALLSAIAARTGAAEPDESSFTVLNKVDHRRPIAADVQLLAETVLDGQLIGSVHYDEAISEAFAHKMLVTEYEPQAQAVRDLESLGGTILRHLNASPARGGTSTAAAPEIRATRDI